MTKDPDEINDMLIAIRDFGKGLSKWEEDFIDSIEEWWSERRTLSDKQKDILERIYKEKAK